MAKSKHKARAGLSAFTFTKKARLGGRNSHCVTIPREIAEALAVKDDTLLKVTVCRA